jgi:hypothetical protein
MLARLVALTSPETRPATPAKQPAACRPGWTRLALAVVLAVLLGGLPAHALAQEPGAGEPTTGTQEPGSGPPEPTSDFGGAEQSAATPGEASYQPTGSIVADSGFRAGADGFSFQNYGGAAGATDMTPLEVRALFGPGVCENPTVQECILTPPADQWRQSTNQAMAGGHCMGFSVASLAFYFKLANQLRFGAPTTPALGLPGNQSLQSFIAYGWAYQRLASVSAGTVKGSTTTILQTLVAALRNRSEAYTLGILRRDPATGALGAGHAITPYAIEYNGGTTFHILVYDNNHPGVQRSVAVDTGADRWSYEAATNPNEASALYQGDAQNQMLLLPTIPGTTVQPCPFCGNDTAGAASARAAQAHKAAGSPTYNEVSLIGDPTDHAKLLITDSAGRQLGYVGNQLVDQIPGASAPMDFANQDWKANEEPPLRVPAGMKFSVAINGTALHHIDTERVIVTGPGHDLAVDKIIMHPGQTDQLQVSADSNAVSYRTGFAGGESPTIEVGDQTSSAGFAFLFQLTTPLKANASLVLANDPTRDRLSIRTKPANTRAAFNVILDRDTTSGRQRFTHSGLHLSRHERAILHYAGFSQAGQGIPLVTVHNGTRRRSVLAATG